VWGVGTVGGEPWPVSPADIADETQTATEHLRTLGLGAGGLVLIVSRLAETIHVAPLELAAGRLDARWSSADATEGDAFRVASLIRQLTPDVVIGVNADVVATLDDHASVFASVPVVAVTDAIAWRAIDGARWWLRLGPTSAFECDARAGAHVDGQRWRVDIAADGEVLVTNLVSRLAPATRLATGVRGHVVDEACSCGRIGPRVVVDP
jgi:hypothetical protein